MYLLDTNVVIYHLRSRRDITELLRRLSNQEGLAISVLVSVEARAGMTEWERPMTEEFLNSVTHYDVTSTIASRAGDFIRSFRSQGITLSVVDAVIAATAVVHDLTLVTLNRRHYPMPEVKLYPLQ